MSALNLWVVAAITVIFGVYHKLSSRLDSLEERVKKLEQAQAKVGG